MTTRRTPTLAAKIALPLLAIVFSLAPAARAAGRINVSSGLTLTGSAPLAIHGYDPVAFFTEGKAIVGQAAHSVAHDGAAFYFASEKNQKAFEANPSHYLPQYGGFCAFGVALGAKFDSDPRLFAVVEDKLYFNLNPDIQAKWKADLDGNIKKAEGNWPKIQDKAPGELK